MSSFLLKNWEIDSNFFFCLARARFCSILGSNPRIENYNFTNVSDYLDPSKCLHKPKTTCTSPFLIIACEGIHFLGGGGLPSEKDRGGGAFRG